MQLLRRALRKRPSLIVRRVAFEASAEAERYLAPRRGRRFDRRRLLQATGDVSIGALWQRLAARPYPAHTTGVDAAQYRRLCPADEEKIHAAAADALNHRVRLLGSEQVDLGPQIDWLCDFSPGVAWPRRFMRDITYVNHPTQATSRSRGSCPSPVADARRSGATC